jgi:hypothetical protein
MALLKQLGICASLAGIQQAALLPFPASLQRSLRSVQSMADLPQAPWPGPHAPYIEGLPHLLLSNHHYVSKAL